MKKQAKPTVRQRIAKVVLRLIELEKKAFDRVAESVGSLQARADKVVQEGVEGAKWMPKEGKQLVVEWLHTIKKSRGDVRKAVDTTFDLSTDFVKRVNEPAPATAKKRVPVPVVAKKRVTVARRKMARRAAAA